jgi:hypothetical protein
MAKEATAYYDSLVRGIAPTDLQTWEEQIHEAEQHRLADRSVMDIIGARSSGDPDLIDSTVPGTARGPAQKWLSLALIIEQKQ